MPHPPTNPFDRLISGLQEGLDLFLDDLQNTAEDFLITINREAARNLRNQVRVATQHQATRRPLRPPINPTGHPATPPSKMHQGTPKPRVLTAYDYLEVSPHASKETIVAAFQSLGRRFHPDNKTTGDAERFKTISAAYTILKDPGRRKKYDRTIQI
jgi:DnaJ-class molecular chaperone